MLGPALRITRRGDEGVPHVEVQVTRQMDPAHGKRQGCMFGVLDMS